MSAPFARSAPPAQKLGEPLAVAGHVAHVPPVEFPARLGLPGGHVRPVLLDLDPEGLQQGEDFLVGSFVGGSCCRARHGNDNMRRALARSKAIRLSEGAVA